LYAVKQRTCGRYFQNDPVIDLTRELGAEPSLPRAAGLECPEEGDQVRLFLRGKLSCEHQVEEFHRVFERQQAAIVKIRRAVFDRAVGTF